MITEEGGASSTPECNSGGLPVRRPLEEAWAETEDMGVTSKIQLQVPKVEIPHQTQGSLRPFKVLCLLFAKKTLRVGKGRAWDPPSRGRGQGHIWDTCSSRGLWWSLDQPGLGVLGGDSFFFKKTFCFILGYMVAQTVKRLPAMQETWVRVEPVYNSETQTVLSSSGLQTGCPHVEFSMLCNSFPPFSVHFRVYQPRQKGTGKTVKCRAHPGTTSTPVVQMRCRNLEAGNQKGRW